MKAAESLAVRIKALDIINILKHKFSGKRKSRALTPFFGTGAFRIILELFRYCRKIILKTLLYFKLFILVSVCI